MKRKCELCNKAATSYCQSDQAILCWSCDAAVHGANFLVAKHSRILLCTVCQAPTRWTGAGVQLRPDSRTCSACIDDNVDDGAQIDNGDDGSCTSDEDEESDSHDDEDDDDGDHDGDGASDDDDDQVVPSPMCIPSRTIKK